MTEDGDRIILMFGRVWGDLVGLVLMIELHIKGPRPVYSTWEYSPLGSMWFTSSKCAKGHTML